MNKESREVAKMVQEQLEKSILPCPYCSGGGKVKAMQCVATQQGTSRGQDKTLTCKHCNGTGRRVKW